MAKILAWVFLSFAGPTYFNPAVESMEHRPTFARGSCYDTHHFSGPSIQFYVPRFGGKSNVRLGNKAHELAQRRECQCPPGDLATTPDTHPAVVGLLEPFSDQVPGYTKCTNMPRR